MLSLLAGLAWPGGMALGWTQEDQAAAERILERKLRAAAAEAKARAEAEAKANAKAEAKAKAEAEAIAKAEAEAKAKAKAEAKLKAEAEAIAKAKAEVLSTFAASMVAIPGGRFQMGCSPKDGDCNGSEKPAHEVSIKPFRLGKYEVTQMQWRGVMGNNPSRFKGDDHPVENVSWNDSQTFLKLLNADNPGKPYRLPTEAEWEYAARAGSTTRYLWGDKVGQGQANCDRCGRQWDNKRTTPVGSFTANAFGLYDTAGNVWEWVQDCWHDDYGKAPADGSEWRDNCQDRRVLRGGSWHDNPGNLRVSFRFRNYPDNRLGYDGLRLAQDLAEAKAEADTKAEAEFESKVKAAAEAQPKGLASIARTMVDIPGGRFQMGCSSQDGNCHEDEKPAHPVTINPFRLSKYEVTQAQWRAVMGSNPAYFKDDVRPVENVSWDDIQDFLKRLNADNPGKPYRLPTEAEWEYAARAGSATPYWWGDKIGQGNANCNDCGSQWDGNATAPVGSFKANAFGLYDTAGNVREWVADCWHDNYQGAPANGSEWRDACLDNSRVLRGGSWYFIPEGLRVSHRNVYKSGYRTDINGLRLAQDR